MTIRFGKKTVLIVGVAVAAIGVIAISLFSGAFKPPVDISKVPALSAGVEPFTVIPDQLLGQSLLRTVDVSRPGHTSFRAEYTDFYIIIGRAQNEGIASGTIDDLYAFYKGKSGSSTSVGGSWFTYDGEGSVFEWRTGVWFFLVWAPNGTTRNQLAQELVNYLAGVSG